MPIRPAPVAALVPERGDVIEGLLQCLGSLNYFTSVLLLIHGLDVLNDRRN